MDIQYSHPTDNHKVKGPSKRQKIWKILSELSEISAKHSAMFCFEDLSAN